MRKFLISLAVIFLLNACAFNATQEGMTIKDKPTASELNRNFEKTIEVEPVTRDKDVSFTWHAEIGNDEFRSALRDSLATYGYTADSADSAKYELSATFKKADQPWFGFNMTVTTVVEYVLVDKVSKKVVVKANISATSTKSMGDSLLGAKRLRLADEGSALKSIQQFLETLRAFGDPTKQVTLRFR